MNLLDRTLLSVKLNRNDLLIAMALAAMTVGPQIFGSGVFIKGGFYTLANAIMFSLGGLELLLQRAVQLQYNDIRFLDTTLAAVFVRTYV